MLGNFYLVHMDDLKHDKNIVVVADRNIPFLDTLIGDSVTLKRLKPEEITADVVKDADALITRTRTRCDSSCLMDHVASWSPPLLLAPIILILTIATATV